MLGHRADLKAFFEVSGGRNSWHAPNKDFGGAIDQINAAGYQTYTSQAAALSGSDTRLSFGLEGGGATSSTASGLENVFGGGWAASSTSGVAGIQGSMLSYHDPETSATAYMAPEMPIPPLHMDWQGYMRNFLDESAADLFTNAKHAASKKVNLLSIYRSTKEAHRGGEGRDGTDQATTFGVGVRSLNLFDLDRQI